MKILVGHVVQCFFEFRIVIADLWESKSFHTSSYCGIKLVSACHQQKNPIHIDVTFFQAFILVFRGESFWRSSCQSERSQRFRTSASPYTMWCHHSHLLLFANALFLQTRSGLYNFKDRRNWSKLWPAHLQIRFRASRRSRKFNH